MIRLVLILALLVTLFFSTTTVAQDRGFGLDVFFELVPLLDLVPSTNFELNGAIGIRYLF